MRNIALSVRDFKLHGMNAVSEINGIENGNFPVLVFGGNNVSVNICLCGGGIYTRCVGFFRIFRHRRRKIHTVVNYRCVVFQYCGIGHTCRSIRNITENRGFAVIHNGRIVYRYIVDEKRKFSRIRFCFIVFPGAVFDIPFNHGSVIAFRLIPVFGRGAGKTVILHRHGIVTGESGKVGVEVVPAVASHALAIYEELGHCG